MIEDVTRCGNHDSAQSNAAPTERVRSGGHVSLDPEAATGFDVVTVGRPCALVTGGTGFIGQHLVRLLAQRGERVRVLDLDPPVEPPRHYEFIQGSILDRGTVREALAGATSLYHLAGNPNLWTRRKSDFFRVNHQGTRLVLEEAARCDLDRIVFTSTESILKSRRVRDARSTLIDESVRLALDDMPGPYCQSKFLAEQEAFAAAERGQPVVIVNPTLPIGPGDHRLTPPTAMILRFLNGEAPAYLDCEMNFVDVRTAALGHILAAERGTVGERYILGGENLSLGQILAMLRELTGLAMPSLRIPYWLALATSVISEAAADLVTRRPPIAPITGVRLARSPTCFDSSKATRELGLPHSSTKLALAELIRWFSERGMLRRKPPYSLGGPAFGVQR